MRSLGNSTKGELYEQLFDSISEEFGGVMLPLEERNFIVWDNDGLAHEKVEKRKAELLEEFGTLEGFSPMIIHWGKPEDPTGPDEEKEA